MKSLAGAVRAALSPLLCLMLLVVTVARGDDGPCPECKHCVPPRPCPGEPEEFVASLVPSSSTIETDSLVTVSFFAESTATHFNGYDLTLRFDPAVVSFVSIQEGALMTDACPSNWFQHWVSDSTVVVSHSLLCADSTVFGPGDLSLFTFRGEQEGLSDLELTVTFYDAGLFVFPCHCERPREVSLNDAVIVVGSGTGAPEGPVGAPPTGVEFRPNPTRGGGEFRLTSRSAGPVRLDVVDAAGRRVFSREWASPPSPAWIVPWAGIDGSGRPLAAGVYFARLFGEEGPRTTRIVRIR